MFSTLIGLYLSAVAALAAWLYLRYVVGRPPAGSTPEEVSRAMSYRRWMRTLEIGSAALFLLAIGFTIGRVYRPQSRESSASEQKRPELTVTPAEEAELRRVVRESQMLEFLTFYKRPDKVDKEALRTYWLSAELGGREIVNVEESLDRLLRRGWRYGQESQAEQFAIVSVRALEVDLAEVRTRERWFLPLYDKQGRRVPGKNDYFGPYDAAYTLRKVDGKWLIAQSTTPRAK